MSESVVDLAKKILQKPASTLAVPIPERSCKEDPCYYYTTKEGFYGYCNKMNKDLKINLANTCPLYNALTPEDVRDIVSLEASLSLLKQDIADMKATLGTLKAIKTIPSLKKIGGFAGVNEYSTDTEISEMIPANSPTWVTKRSFSLSTPSIPSGITVLKYAFQVAIETKSQTAINRIKCRVLLDGTELIAEFYITTTYTWYEKARDISGGQHTVEIQYCNPSGSADIFYLRGTRGLCGIGTCSLTDVKLVSGEVSGDTSSRIMLSGKCWKEVNPSISYEMRLDDDPIVKKSGSVTVTTGGTKYAVTDNLKDYAIYSNEVYGKTSNTNVAAFLDYSKAIAGISLVA